MIVLSFEVDLRLLPELEDQLHAFPSLVDPCFRIVPCAVSLEFCLGPSCAHAEDCASGRQNIHGRDHLGQHCWRTKRDRGDNCSELDILSLSREISEGDPAFYSRIFLWLPVGFSPHVMVRDHRTPEPELVSKLNCWIGQAPSVVPVSETRKNEPQNSTPHVKL